LKDRKGSNGRGSISSKQVEALRTILAQLIAEPPKNSRDNRRAITMNAVAAHLEKRRIDAAKCVANRDLPSMKCGSYFLINKPKHGHCHRE
jgi:hypothetical protein